MKKINIYAVIVALGMLAVAGCKKLDEVNTNPNYPSKITPATQLLGAELNIGFAAGGDMSRFASLFDQQVVGASRQQQLYGDYIVGNADFDAAWNTMYQGMMNLNDMINTAQKSNYKAYVGVGKVLMAYSLGICTDVWGDMPYSKAFQGSADFQPAFDNQQALYTTMQTLLDEGITALQDGNPGLQVPGTDDIVFNGDINSWLALAHGLKARFYLHTNKVNGNANLAQIVSEANTALGLWGKNAYFYFGTSELNAGPVYQFGQSRPGDLAVIGSVLESNMATTNDPRYAQFIDGNSDYPGPFYSSPNSGVQIMNEAEVHFILAEALYLQGDKGGAASASNDGAIASVTEVTGAAPDAGWTTAYASLTDASADLYEKIMTQKYLALFLNPESYTDWRRTGFPALSPTAGSSLGSIPRRYLYSETETERNKNCPRGVQLTQRVWWDVQ